MKERKRARSSFESPFREGEVGEGVDGEGGGLEPR